MCGVLLYIDRYIIKHNFENTLIISLKCITARPLFYLSGHFNFFLSSNLVIGVGCLRFEFYAGIYTEMSLPKIIGPSILIPTKHPNSDGFNYSNLFNYPYKD
jgi:hypothetical protein